MTLCHTLNKYRHTQVYIHMFIHTHICTRVRTHAHVIMMMEIAPSSQIIAVSWFSSIIWIDAFSLTVSGKLTFQSSNSLIHAHVMTRMKKIAPSLQMIAVSWFFSIICIDAFSLTVSSTMTFQSSNSLRNLEAEIYLTRYLKKVSVYHHVSF